MMNIIWFATGTLVGCVVTFFLLAIFIVGARSDKDE